MKKILNLSLMFFLLVAARAQNCPTSIRVQSPSEVTSGDTLIFTVVVNGGNFSPTYNWSVSAGWIMSGQGTPTIMVNTDSIAGMSVTATADLGGLPRECNSVSSATTDIISAPEKIIAADYTTPQALTAAVQKLILQTNLKNLDITQTAFIYIYGDASNAAAQVKIMQTTISKAFEKNGILSFQYKIADGGKKKKASFEMFRLGPGVGEPGPSN